MKPNEERNKELVRKRLGNPERWSFGELGKHYRMDKKTVHEIFERDINKYATAREIVRYRKVAAKITFPTSGELSTVG